MAIEVQMVEDVRKFDAKVIGPLNKRQMICVLAGAVLAIPAITIPKDVVLKVVLAILLAGPMLLCGWIKYHGMYFEMLALRVMYLYFLTPKKRRYRSINIYREAERNILKKEEREKLKTLSAKEKKEYLSKKKKTKIVYSKVPEYQVFR